MPVWDLTPTDPRLVGPYRTRAVLGEGDMGRVLLAVAPDGELAAVKLVHGAFAANDQSFRQRLHREALAARRVESPHTARVINSDANAGVPWLAYAFHHGPTLHQALHAAGPFTEETVLHLAAGLATALRDIHAQNFIHRDLSASNILLTANKPVVIDFGIARPTIHPDDTPHATKIITITQTGIVIGNPAFMSPEQAMGNSQLTPASDIFALGTVLAMAATGQNPFQGATSEQTRLNIITKEPDLTRVPPRLRHIIEPCFARNPTHRPTATNILTTIGPPPPTPQPWPEPINQLINTQKAEIHKHTSIDPTTILPGPQELDPTKIFARWRGSAAVERHAPVGVQFVTEPAVDGGSVGSSRLSRRLRLLALAVAAVALLIIAIPWAIPANEVSHESPPDTADAFPVRIEHAFGETVIGTRPKRVATWGWGAAEAAIALGTFPVGITGEGALNSDQELQPWVADAYRAGGTEAPVVFDRGVGPRSVPYEQIRSTSPDLILAPYSSLDKEQYDKLSAIAPVVARPKGQSAEPWEGVVSVTATALGIEREGADLLAGSDAYLAGLGERHGLTGLTFAAIANNPSKREVIVFLGAAPSVRVIEGLGMRLAGSVRELNTSGEEITYRLGYEDLDRLDCDILLLYSTTREMANLDRANKDLKTLPAFAAGRVAQTADTAMWNAVVSPTVLSIRWPNGLPALTEALAEAAAN
ncbi:protein kinase [Micromonospora sp. NPDC047620]|uniref:protein kinase domain-containing protein n=1 Tax=Micromonospora sp. NPDC047620 TaxID=3364251 RepID=UPI0037235146